MAQCRSAKHGGFPHRDYALGILPRQRRGGIHLSHLCFCKARVHSCLVVFVERLKLDSDPILTHIGPSIVDFDQKAAGCCKYKNTAFARNIQHCPAYIKPQLKTSNSTYRCRIIQGSSKKHSQSDQKDCRCSPWGIIASHLSASPCHLTPRAKAPSLTSAWSVRSRPLLMNHIYP